MTTHGILSLPTELLDLIVTFLPTTEPKRDIAACRLVCSQLRASSSPHLITRVVFAKRFREIEKLQWVVNHPYFSKTVTEFVYDGSAFEEDTAREFSRYVLLCERAEASGSRQMEDEEWVRMKRHDVEAYNGLQKFADVSRSRVKSTALDQDPAEDGDTTVYGGLSVVELEQVDPYGLGLETDQAPVLGNKGYRLGCHKTWPIYRQFYRAQEALEYEGMCHGILVDAFAKLPALSSVAHSDYRCLFRAKESYDVGCRRLFGGALEPMSDPDGHCDAPLMPLLRAIAERTVRFESLTAGRQPLDWTPGTWTWDWTRNVEDGTEAARTRPVLFAEFGSMHNPDLKVAGKAFSLFSRLDLHMRIDELQVLFGGNSCYETTHDLVFPFARELFGHSLAQLTHLTFAIEDICIPPYENENEPPGEDIFERMLAPCTLHSLEYLHLAGWKFRLRDMQEWLGRHRETLREVRLLYNVLRGRSEDLALWAGQHLPSLSGVEIYNYIDRLWPEQETAIAGDEDDEENGEIDEPAEFGTDEQNEALETQWLGGRTNSLEATRMVERMERPESMRLEHL